MSTPCTITCCSLYPRLQVQAEIRWLDAEIMKVTKLMEKRPSKWRHLKDLQRQKNDRLEILSRS
jgi:hypothetical protein